MLTRRKSSPPVQQLGSSSVAAVQPMPAGTKAPRKPMSRPQEIVRNTLLHVVLIAIILGGWRLAAIWVEPVWISSPTLVLDKLRDWIDQGSLWHNVNATMYEAVIGLVIGTVLGIVVGLLLHRFVLLSKIVWPYLMTGYSLPRIALAPFFVLWFGIGLMSKVLLVVSVVFFIVLFNVKQGVETVDRDLMDVMRSMRAKRWDTLRYVLMPTIVPWVVAAVKISVGTALVSAVVGEMVGSTEGLGWLVTDSINRFDMTGALTALFVMAVLARGMYYVLAIAERRLFRWRKESGAAEVPG